ncbi:MAG: hypothetical protein IPK05_19685 [Comamonadaceae bacterium]|nr:hypothetical protein [Comamonadaceae bacterium]
MPVRCATARCAYGGSWSRLASQRERIQRLRRVLVPASTDNQQLSARSREAGQIGLLD